MDLLSELGKLHQVDVLVVGGGVSGLFAGIRARQFVERVMVVDKGPIGRTSQAYFALGGHQAFLPGDDLASWMKDVVYFEDGLCEQDLVESVYRETYDRIKDFEEFGVEFIKNDDGGYRRFPTRGLEHVRGLRPNPHGIGGKLEVEALVREASRRGVQLLSHVMITDILTNDQGVQGAIGFQTKSGDFQVFEAKAIVLASGQCSFKGHYADQAFSTGEGLEMAYKAGAELKNLEFATLWLQPAHYTWEAVGTALPMGARLLNAKGERFMDKYCPTLKDMVDFNYIARACAFEARKGNAPFYLDYSPIKPADLEFLRKREGWMEIHTKKLDELGIKPFDEKQEWMPVFWAASGIRSDICCRTSVPGLFVGGRARSVDPGVTMGSWSIGSATVLGYRAGENAAKYAIDCGSLELSFGNVSKLKEQLYEPLGVTRGPSAEEIIMSIQKIIFAYDVMILKHETRLKDALVQMEVIRDELTPRVGARDTHELVKLREARSMVFIAELVLRASIMRTESRASHFREDYPARDDKNWLKWIVIRQVGGQSELRTEPLPLERYAIKPEIHYMDNFVLPK